MLCSHSLGQASPTARPWGHLGSGMRPGRPQGETADLLRKSLALPSTSQRTLGDPEEEAYRQSSVPLATGQGDIEWETGTVPRS